MILQGVAAKAAALSVSKKAALVAAPAVAAAGPDKVTQNMIAVAILLFLLRPLAGLVIDMLKIMLRLSVAGMVLQLVPLDMIDEWSRATAGWANISARFVPVVALITLFAISTTSIPFFSGKSVEAVARIILYVVGGVFTAGSAGWIAWQSSVGELVRGAFGVTIGALQIIGVSIGA